MRVAIAVGVMLVFGSGKATAEVYPLPPVKVIADRVTDGSTIVCRSTLCEGVVIQMAPPPLEYVDVFLSEGPDEVESVIDKEEFCAALKAKAPANCSVDNPPSVPGFDPNWSDNGCGDGSIQAAIGSALLDYVVPQYTGQLTTPLPGVSFADACRSHDACYSSFGLWGGTQSKGICDVGFDIKMGHVCQGVTSAITRNQCYSVKSAYLFGVQEGGGKAFTNAQAALACAAWAHDMEENECDEE